MVWVRFWPPSRMRASEIKKLLGIPEGKRTVAVVPIGNIDREARRARPKNPNGGRKPMEQYAHMERV